LNGTWLEYDEALNKLTGKPFTICKHCKSVFLHPRRTVNGTSSSMRTHVFERCQAYRRANCDRLGSSPGIHGFFASASMPSRVVTQERVEELLLKFLISGNIPLRQVENQYLRELVLMITINGRPCKTPGRKAIRSQLTKYSNMAVNKLKDAIKANKSRISLALDMWSSRSNHAFMGT